MKTLTSWPVKNNVQVYRYFAQLHFNKQVWRSYVFRVLLVIGGKMLNQFLLNYKFRILFRNLGHHGQWKLIRLLLSVALVVTFLWKASQAWSKYSLGDTMMVSKVRRPEYQNFPTVTLCKGTVKRASQEGIDKIIEQSSNLKNWLYTCHFDNEFL